MKNKKVVWIILVFITVTFLVPQITLAAWWNPLSWFDYWSFLRGNSQETQVIRTVRPLSKRNTEEEINATRSTNPSPEASTGGMPACNSFPQNSTKYLGHNRTTMQCMAGQCTPTDRESGTYKMDNESEKISIRFTSPDNREISSIWLFSSEVKGNPGAIRVSLKDNNDGQPVSGEVLESVSDIPRVGWQRFELAPGNHKLLSGCNVYHIVIEPEGENFNANNYIRYTTNINRFPLQYQATDNRSNGFENFFDPEISLMYNDGSGDFITQWYTGHMMPTPIFVLEDINQGTIGKPYDKHVERVVKGDVQWGQSFTVDPNIETENLFVNYVAMFIKGRELTQDDNLYIDVYDPVEKEVLASTVLIDPPPSVLNRAHWFGAMLPNTLTLKPGNEYYLMLRADDPGSGAGYILSTEQSTIPLSSGIQNPTYGGGKSKVIYSPNRGLDFINVGNADAGFILSNLRDSENLHLGIYDEGYVTKVSDNSAAHIVSPNEDLNFDVELRNIGVEAGTIWVDYVDVGSNTSLLPGGPIEVPNVLPGHDAGATGNITNTTIQAPSSPGLWRVDIHVGHTTNQGVQILDSVTRFEILVRQE